MGRIEAKAEIRTGFHLVAVLKTSDGALIVLAERNCQQEGGSRWSAKGEADSGQPRACGREAKTVWLPGTGQGGSAVVEFFSNEPICARRKLIFCGTSH